ncbi:hypothetical protein GE21DRAFT_2285 [Neurospora crassa]|uniref:Uncharacterized protein n=1 Tax=Neurospora crassa (strain ATCC 24698 / 74-OR23-1A / CBS 708.71 / DSM 1257 / FGSC 987) TaxID=367110 RepID=Q7RUX1_NEUCR|nr:hypothetical protein NCU03014 [Neurospora crassa OR74A]EAA36164.3 hypothetical protein NCU03014 [Neurospora crassa OR74A]KHE89203.1 hypothetical protein GE21DRAFT_2285 [Neurospora crassa]|eukprot:XP_965400.3 hypothetical protein NCU03014 [Neurospora crassa OR74A]
MTSQSDTSKSFNILEQLDGAAAGHDMTPSWDRRKSNSTFQSSAVDEAMAGRKAKPDRRPYEGQHELLELSSSGILCIKLYGRPEGRLRCEAGLEAPRSAPGRFYAAISSY